jgi:hypothetical protein
MTSPPGCCTLSAGIVTGVDIDELGPEVTAARIAVNGPAGPQQVTARLADGLAVAITTGAPVRVAETVMDWLAVPAAPSSPGRSDYSGPGSSDHPRATPGVPAKPGALVRAPRRPRPRYEPRNLTFADGLDGWLFGGSFTEHASQPHWHDYACAAEHGAAVISSAVPEPAGFAMLGQEVFADDYRGVTVIFRGEFRVQADTPGRVGMFLRVNEGHAVRGPLTQRSVFADPDNNITPIPDAAEWTWHEVAARVPDGSDAVVFGIFLAASGRIELRNPALIRLA